MTEEARQENEVFEREKEQLEYIIHAVIKELTQGAGARRQYDHMVQDALIGLWTHRKQWQNAENRAEECRAVVMATLWGLIKTGRRQRERKVRIPKSPQIVAAALWEDPDSLSIANQERWERFTSWIGHMDTTRPALTRKQRYTFYMRHGLGLTEPQIAAIMSITQQMVSKRLAACARRLREQYGRASPSTLAWMCMNDPERWYATLQEVTGLCPVDPVDEPEQ